MKMIATVTLLLGVFILQPGSARADRTECGVSYTTQGHEIPPWCPIGDEYDAGDVTVTRECHDPNNYSDSCSTTWIESYMHRVGADCGDGGFVEQLDIIVSNSCN
ncbi:MAG TPA: hypothetical protein VHT91_02600 [Kofleriaceae bacterium]|jgi:hypothetical protein|nr:hypothetical protein [Kofleriaceae bacterium]